MYTLRCFNVDFYRLELLYRRDNRSAVKSRERKIDRASSEIHCWSDGGGRLEEISAGDDGAPSTLFKRR